MARKGIEVGKQVSQVDGARYYVKRSRESMTVS